MLVIAHRGANREALENSWSAFEKAIEAGAQRLELDVQLSKDGHAVVMHDDYLGHLTSSKGLISETSRSELAKVQLNNGESLPFLDEVIEKLLPRVQLNIEIKGPRPELAEVVCELVDPHPLRENVIVSSFHVEPLTWIQEHFGSIQRACLLARDHWNWPQFASYAPLNFLSLTGARILHPEVGMVDENFMDQALSRGIKVYAWVSMKGEEQDREGLWAVLKTFGVHGLCTNYPRQLVRWLGEIALDERKFKSY